MVVPPFALSLTLRADKHVSIPDPGLSSERTFSVLPPPVPTGRAIVSHSGAPFVRVYSPQRGRTYEVFSPNQGLLDSVGRDETLRVAYPALLYSVQVAPFLLHRLSAANVTLYAFGAYTEDADVLVFTTVPGLLSNYSDSGWWTYRAPDADHRDVSINVRRVCKRWIDWSVRYSSAQRFEILFKRFSTTPLHTTPHERLDRSLGAQEPRPD